MRKNRGNKLLIFVLTILFFGTSAIPSLSVNVRELNNKNFSDNVLTRNSKTINDFRSTQLFFTSNQGQYPKEVLFHINVQDAIVYFCKNQIIPNTIWS